MHQGHQGPRGRTFGKSQPLLTKDFRCFSPLSSEPTPLTPLQNKFLQRKEKSQIARFAIGERKKKVPLIDLPPACSSKSVFPSDEQMLFLFCVFVERMRIYLASSLWSQSQSAFIPAVRTRLLNDCAHGRVTGCLKAEEGRSGGR